MSHFHIYSAEQLYFHRTWDSHPKVHVLLCNYNSQTQSATPNVNTTSNRVLSVEK